ncbi:sn-glycerol-3-phosphate transport system permease protein UgpE [Devosia yakushimensis]|uniref:sn-glycerol-3-phosphate transport system permease protein UgpE n=1 Tax=Devosia yakushimensis TaxID=470028 RepID=A0ABQ5UL41_9HYPH|nr:carbohydrate ABC transporter permease [Devosia yakushimensis]GLQ11913.1 sn-glycerol-3-phosphate transport system permease protein UgpE [Devosia yakushimensis]
MASTSLQIKRGAGLGARHLIYALIAFIFVLPLWWAIVSSLRPNAEVFADIFPVTPKALIPSPLTFEAYTGVFERGFGMIIANTMFVALVTMVAGLIVNGAAGFAFAMFDFKGKKLILSLIIISFMLPFEAIALPLYTVTQQLGWLDNVLALIVPSVANGLAVFLFYQFFSQVPKDYMEAARLDGVSWINILLRIYVPLSMPTCISAALLLFIFQWEAFLWPLLAMPSQQFKVIQVGMAAFQQQYQTIWNQLFAVSVITALIPIALLLPLQRYYVQGLAGAGIKG